MFWTHERPTEDGYYWLRNGSKDVKPIVAHVMLGEIFFPGEKRRYTFADIERTAQWCKIPQPEKKRSVRRPRKPIVRRNDTTRPSEDRQAILRPKETAKFLNVSVPTLYRWEKEQSDFPKKVKLGMRASGWRKGEIEKWLTTRYFE